MGGRERRHPDWRIGDRYEGDPKGQGEPKPEPVRWQKPSPPPPTPKPAPSGEEKSPDRKG